MKPDQNEKGPSAGLSIVIPCYNEEKTLRRCVERVLAIRDENLHLEIIVVDDASTDASESIGRELAERHCEIRFYRQERNMGKGAALRTGFQKARLDFVAVQDADLEYDPRDLKKLIIPLVEGNADVVFGSRFLSSGTHRVLYFWHSMANTFLTFLSNMFTDLNLTDMETCYKVFRRDVIQSIHIEEERFGVEPELTAKIAHMRLRIFETGISYYGRTYEEGKKIGLRDGLWALYCIFHYNASRAPAPLQFLFYLFIGGTAGLFNLGLFLLLMAGGAGTDFSTIAAFLGAALFNYWLCILLLFRHKARWSSTGELAAYFFIVVLGGGIDYISTTGLISLGSSLVWAKSLASIIGLIFNYLGRRYIVFPEPRTGPWKPQTERED